MTRTRLSREAAEDVVKFLDKGIEVEQGWARDMRLFIFGLVAGVIFNLVASVIHDLILTAFPKPTIGYYVYSSVVLVSAIVFVSFLFRYYRKHHYRPVKTLTELRHKFARMHD